MKYIYIKIAPREMKNFRCWYLNYDKHKKYEKRKTKKSVGCYC
jgi:hypothetical protein